MVNEVQKFRVEIFKIAGFALLTPIGRAFFEPVALFKECGLILFLIYLIVAIGLSIVGLQFILTARDILDLEERKQWKS